MERVIGYTESFWVSAMQFIAECTAKRKEILDAAKDTADDTELPDIEALVDDARVEVVDQYVVIRETHEFPIVGEWTRDRRKFLKCEIRIHVPAGSIAQGEYDIS